MHGWSGRFAIAILDSNLPTCSAYKILLLCALRTRTCIRILMRERERRVKNARSVLLLMRPTHSCPVAELVQPVKIMSSM